MEKMNKPAKKSSFSVKFDPRLPAIQVVQAKYRRAMVGQDQYLASVFPEPPLTAFKQQSNLRDILIRAEVPEPTKKLFRYLLPSPKIKPIVSIRNEIYL